MTEEIISSVEQKETTKEDSEYLEVVEPYGFIYITTNLIDGMRYLGQRKFYQGWRTYLGSGILLNKAIKEYGKENFKKDIICFCYSAEELNKTEYSLSVFFNVVKDSNWYNMCYGGGAVSGWTMSDEQRKHISEIKKNMSDEYRMKISIGTRKAMQSPELRKHLSDKAKERTSIPENCNMFGKHHTEETRKKMSQIAIARDMTGERNPNYRNGKRVGKNNPNYGNHSFSGENNPMYGVRRYGADNPNYGNHKLAGANNPMYGDHRWAGANNPRARSGVQLTKGGEFIQQWSYLKEGADSLGVDVNNIVSCCAYRIPSAYGFKWMYLEEYEKYKHLPCEELIKLWKKENL